MLHGSHFQVQLLAIPHVMPNIRKHEIIPLPRHLLLPISEGIGADHADLILVGELGKQKSLEQLDHLGTAFHDGDGVHVVLAGGHKGEISQAQAVGQHLSVRLFHGGKGGYRLVGHEGHPFPAIFQHGGITISSGEEADLRKQSAVGKHTEIVADKGLAGGKLHGLQLPLPCFALRDANGLVIGIVLEHGGVQLTHHGNDIVGGKLPFATVGSHLAKGGKTFAKGAFS